MTTRWICKDCIKKELEEGWFIHSYPRWNDKAERCYECGKWGFLFSVGDWKLLWEIEPKSGDIYKDVLIHSFTLNNEE